MNTRTLAGATLAVVAMAAFVTWPQALHLGTHIASHDDPMFTMWRVQWFAHAVRDPGHFFDANILYPAPRTFTFADMTFVEAALAAPFLWLKVPPTLVYNLLLLGGFAGSGVGVFVLARYLSGETAPAMVAAAIFTMAPYRIEHFMHLELQWAMWIPLTFWALHRAVDEGSWRAGLLAGLFFFLQVASCVYYGIFLAMTAPVLVGLLLIASPRRIASASLPLVLAGLLAAALTIVYLWPFLETSRMAGPRDPSEVAAYSALPVSYLASPPQNWLWGWTSARWGRAELSLYPGIVAVLLAATAIVLRPRRTTAIYAVLTALAVELSLGSNGWLYPRLAHLGVVGGLRSPSRFEIVALCGVAVLAAYGVEALRRTLSARVARFVVPVALVLIAADFANRGMYLTPASHPQDGTIYRVVRSAGPGAVIELPLPVPEGLPGRDAFYQYWSTAHWHPLVNGYTAVYTPEYIETLDRMRTFPDDRSVARLQTLGVRYVIVHAAFYEPDRYRRLLVSIGNRPELQPYGVYKDPIGEAQLFVLR